MEIDMSGYMYVFYFFFVLFFVFVFVFFVVLWPWYPMVCWYRL